MFLKKDFDAQKLEEQVWKSEMERQKLEYQFEQLMRERHKCEKSAIKAIKLRYEQFLEEDRQRMERNNNLLRMLERIDYQAATLAAKTERLKLLKAQHELYLMRSWNIQRAILPSFEASMPILQQPVTEILPINFTQQQTFVPSQQLQQQNISSTLLSSSALPAQQSIYYPPFKIPPQKGETNLKSDFVKYLSQINQFRDIYDKNGMPDSTYQSDLSVKGIPGEPSIQQQVKNDDYTSPMTAYPNAYYQDQIAAIDSRFYGNNKFIPLSHPAERRIPEIYDYPQHPYHQYQHHQQQKTDAINNRIEFTEAIKPKLTNDEIIKNDSYHTIAASSYKNSATTNDFVVNNSSNIQPDINNTAVSISNTSANASAINTNGVIKAIHQNKDENYVPPVRFQLNDNDVFRADGGENISGVAQLNAIGYVNRMPQLDSSIRQIPHESTRNNPMITDARDAGTSEIENQQEKSTQQQMKNYEFNDVRPDIDKIEEVIYGEKINYPEIVEPIRQQQHHSSEEFNKRKHIMPSNVGQSSDVNGADGSDENKVLQGMQQLNIENATEIDAKNLKEKMSSLNENPQNEHENKLVLSDYRNDNDSSDSNVYMSSGLDGAQMQMNDTEANKFNPIYYGESDTNSTSVHDINNPPQQTQELDYESQSNDAIHYQQLQTQNIDHESMSKVYQSQEVNYGMPVADTEDVSHATTLEAMQQGYVQPQQQQQSQGNYDEFSNENQYAHETQPYDANVEQQEYQTNEYGEYTNQPEQTMDYNHSEYYTTQQQQPYSEEGDPSYPADNGENVNYDGQQFQQGNATEEGTYQLPYYGDEANVNGNTSNIYNNNEVEHVQYQDQSYDNQHQQYPQQNLEQYTAVGQSEIYEDGQTYQQHQDDIQLEQPTENVNQNYDRMYQYQSTPNYDNQDQYEYPQESQPPPQQYSSDAYYTEQSAENYYPDESQMPANTLNLTSNNIQNTYMESDAVNEITQPLTLTNVPVEHANDSQYENKYAPDGDTNGEEESSTTYSENVNIPQGGGGGAVENMLPVGVQGNITGNVEKRVNVPPPNYLESESDESSAQQVKEIANDESDFDFSAN